MRKERSDFDLEKRTIFNVIRKKYVSKIDKYVVDLGFRNSPKVTVWMTEKQLINLLNCFEETNKGYSDKDISVIGVWNEKGFYSYAYVVHHKNKKLFKEPRQYDLSDLNEDG